MSKEPPETLTPKEISELIEKKMRAVSARTRASPSAYTSVPAADAITNTYSRDVIGNKTDAANKTTDQASVIGLLRQMLDEHIFQHQPDAVVVTATPVSGAKNEVLATTKNVRIISIAATITWAVTQPTPLEVHVTIDGVAQTYSFTDPVSNTNYFIYPQTHLAAASQQLSATDTLNAKAFQFEGRNIKVESEITWATTQPTNLTVRVKYAKIP